MRTSAVTTVVTVAILIAAVAGYIYGGSAERTVTITTTTSTTSSYTNPENSLQLEVRLNTTVIHSGEAISARIGLFNPLGTNLSVIPPLAPDQSIQAWNEHDFICGGDAGGQFHTLVGFALFAGHYAYANISEAAAPLNLTAQPTVECALFLPPSLLTFLPQSNETWAYPQYGQSPPSLVQAEVNASTLVGVDNPDGSTGCGFGDSLYGYWAAASDLSCGGTTSSSPYFHYFPAGQYTLAVLTAWGEAKLAYFEVAPGS